MLSVWLLIIISLAYISLLFGIAWAGDRHPTLYRKQWARPHVYSLSLAVYFTSWTFYGAVGRATQEGIEYLSIYLGPLLMFLFGANLIRRIITISKRNNSTSIADFIASRYGKSQSLAALVAIIALIGSIPYIALQLKAIAMGFNILSDHAAPTAVVRPTWSDSAWYITVALAAFTILFGTRHLESTEHHRGMIQAIAFESIIKLVAFVAVGLFVIFSLYDGPVDLADRVREANLSGMLTLDPVDPTTMITQTLIAMLAIICLPRQFHVTVVENADHRDFNVARWEMPAYLIIASAFVIPIAAAGLLSGVGTTGVDPDGLILSLPMEAGSQTLAVLAYLGGGSAAAAMVIVCSVAVATMISNEAVMPAALKLFQSRIDRKRDISRLLLWTRRVAILLILLTAYGFYRVTGEDHSLTAFGLLSFAAAAQFGPALLGGIVWRRGNQQGAFWGLIVGFALWVYTLLIPALVSTGWIPAALTETGLFGLSWTRPTALFGMNLDQTSHGVIWSLGLNLAVYIFISLATRQRVREKIQIASFFHDPEPRPETPQEQVWHGEVLTGDLQALADRFMGEERANAAFRNYERRNAVRLSPQRTASYHLMKYVEKQLASVIGASTARVVLESTLTGRDMQIEDVVSIVDEASQAMTFSRELLQSAIEHISLGVLVTNNQQHLMVWNRRFLEMFAFPLGFVKAGRPAEDLVRYSLVTVNMPARRIDRIVEEVIQQMRSGELMSDEHHRPDGTVLQIEGNPIPGGGYVITFQDITPIRRTEQALKETNIYLEQRVKERTEELQELNEQLLAAKSVAEQANQSKTRFLASASHDLLQPLNAARLFTSALAGKSEGTDLQELVGHVDSSLEAAEEIISTLLDISKLDAGALEPEVNDFPILDTLNHLATEFSAIAEEEGLELKMVPSSAWVHSDPKLLRRVIQNFLSNAMRYTPSGRILLGCRRVRDQLRIEVWDTGPGIPEDKVQHIFEEFQRLKSTQNTKGLGLGLAIVDRISTMLGLPVDVRSRQGKGSVFSITVPMARPRKPVAKAEPKQNQKRSVASLQGLPVLAIDNDPSILEGMEALLGNWQCAVTPASGLEDALEKLGELPPAIILADYQLDNEENGLDTMDTIQEHFNLPIPGILITGYLGSDIRAEAHNRGYQILFKPVKPAPLRAMINKLLRKGT